MPAIGGLPADGYLVYIFVDPRDGLPFYVGMTCRPAMRWRGHHNDTASPAYSRLRELRALGLKCRVRVMREGMERRAALAYERSLIERHLDVVLNTFVGCGKPPHFSIVEQRKTQQKKP